MGLVLWIIVLVAIALICRALRSKFQAVDWIAYLLVLVLFIVEWISEGFWMGLLVGFIGCVAIALFFGIGGGTEVRMFGHKYTLTCDDCGYNHLEILERNEYGVTTRCKRCGRVTFHILNH